uniref:Uncharacterized protein n=1 Tax=Steinernema glaseri TaxID=37863 RepID=A0A1I7Z4N8_9BILA
MRRGVKEGRLPSSGAVAKEPSSVPERLSSKGLRSLAFEAISRGPFQDPCKLGLGPTAICQLVPTLVPLTEKGQAEFGYDVTAKIRTFCVVVGKRIGLSDDFQGHDWISRYGEIICHRGLNLAPSFVALQRNAIRVGTLPDALGQS